MYKFEKKRNEAKDVLRNAIKSARGNYDIIIFHDASKRIIKALNELRIFWCEINGEIYVNRHKVYDMITY